MQAETKATPMDLLRAAQYNLLVTGGLGFIGSNFVNAVFPAVRRLVNLDKGTYAARRDNVDESVRTSAAYTLVEGDICDAELLAQTLQRFEIDAVVHFAAESHVDTSFQNALLFTKTNVEGTHSLLEACRRWGKVRRFIHVSTDEVYGENAAGRSTEQSALCPTNPYAASKAGAELLARAYFHSFKFPVIITRGNNVYGPCQHPEKLVPRFILQALHSQQFSVHGQGLTRRNFLHVSDAAAAFVTVLARGRPGRTYNIGTDCEKTVLEVAAAVQAVVRPDRPLQASLKFVEDRCFNDCRYCVDSNELTALGWAPQVSFADGMSTTVEWYRAWAQALPEQRRTTADVFRW